MYERIIRHLLPEVEFHQNRYGVTIASAVRGGERWLDLGAGKRIHGGWKGEAQSEVVARACYLVGCDIETDGMTRNPFLNARVNGDGSALPFPTGTFDVVTANMVLEHLDDPLPVLREIERVLSPGGTFIFVTPNRANPGVRTFSWFLTSGLRRTVARILEGREPDDIFHTHYQANTTRDLTRLAGAAGLEVSHLETFSSFPMFRRPALLTLVECLWIRLLRGWPRLHGLESNLVGRLSKPAWQARAVDQEADPPARDEDDRDTERAAPSKAG